MGYNQFRTNAAIVVVGIAVVAAAMAYLISATHNADNTHQTQQAIGTSETTSR